MMTNQDIVEMYYLALSSRNCLNKKYRHTLDDYVNTKCTEFCEKHNINITHRKCIQ